MRVIELRRKNLYDQMINKIISGFHKYRIWMYFEYYLQVRVTHLIFQRASGEMLPYNFSPLNQKSTHYFLKRKYKIIYNIISISIFLQCSCSFIFFFFFLWFFLIMTLDYKWKTLIKTSQASGIPRNGGSNVVLRTHPRFSNSWPHMLLYKLHLQAGLSPFW